MKAERDGIMGEIVGARGTSVTTHVLYVAGKTSDTDSPADIVYKALTNATNGSPVGLGLATTGDD
jgi:hypothetical protein